MLTVYLIGCFSVVMMMFVIWLVHLKLRNATIVDMGWGLGFIIMSYIFIVRGAGWTLRNILIFLMIFLWGLRIIYFIFKRIKQEQHEDRRYAELRQKWGSKADLQFLRIFESQAVLQMFMVLPVLAVAYNPHAGLSVIEWAGLLVWAVALIGESITDEQLAAFKNNPANKGQVCQTGLWNYSRHPNYFFEIMIWVGIYIFSLGSPWGWLTIISPILITHLILNVTGIPLAEQQSLKSRGDLYRRYQQTTSVLIPLPKKRV